MTDSDLQRLPGEIVYHFDVDRHSIPLSQFIETARATQEIIEDFNKSLFDDGLKYELRVKTPEQGSLLEILAIVVTVPGSVLAFLATDIGKAFFKGVTKEEPAAWAEKAGAAIRKKILKLTTPVQDANAVQPSKSVDPASPEALAKNISNEVEGEAVALILIGFLALDTERLKLIGITPEKFRAAFQGRNRVFKGCIDNPEVKGIGFTRQPEFPIRRSDFSQRITELPDKPPEDVIHPADLNFETIDIVVNSPNWKRDGRNWQAATSKYQDISFSIEDESFWRRVEQRDQGLRPTIRDNMRVQWAYPAGTVRPSHVKVFRVLSYNGFPLSPPMTEQEIQALQSTVHFVEPETPDLFDERRGSNENNKKGDE